jgi:phasin
MAKEPQAPFEIPSEMRAAAERSIEEARQAFDKFLNVAKSSLATADDQGKAVQASAKDISATVVSLAEQNMASAFDYAQQLMKAKDPMTLMQLQVDFIQAQMKGLSEQAKAMGDTVSKAASSPFQKK